MKLIELTMADGRRVGLPPLSAIILAAIDPEKEEGARTLIRWHVPGQGARLAKVKDPFKQVLNLFPKSSGGLGWTHASDDMGFDVAFPEGTIASYEEKTGDDGGFSLTLGCETGPLTIDVKATYDEVQGMLGNTPERKAAPPRSSPRKQPAAKPPARGGGKGKAK